jgi:hypothetical protein
MKFAIVTVLILATWTAHSQQDTLAPAWQQQEHPVDAGGWSPDTYTSLVFGSNAPSLPCSVIYAQRVGNQCRFTVRFDAAMPNLDCSFDKANNEVVCTWDDPEFVETQLPERTALIPSVQP